MIIRGIISPNYTSKTKKGKKKNKTGFANLLQPETHHVSIRLLFLKKENCTLLEVGGVQFSGREGFLILVRDVRIFVWMEEASILPNPYQNDTFCTIWYKLVDFLHEKHENERKIRKCKRFPLISHNPNLTASLTYTAPSHVPGEWREVCLRPDRRTRAVIASCTERNIFRD